MTNKVIVKRKLISAICTALACASAVTALSACRPDSSRSNTPPASYSDISDKIEVNTHDRQSEYYAEKLEGHHGYTIFKFEKNYEFFSDEGIDIIAYTGGTSDDKYDNCLSIYPYDQNIQETAEEEMQNAKIMGYTDVKKIKKNSEIPLNHERIAASKPKGEGVIENAESEIYIIEHGETSLVVYVNYTTETKKSIYPYLMAMVKTIDLK